MYTPCRMPLSGQNLSRDLLDLLLNNTQLLPEFQERIKVSTTWRREATCGCEQKGSSFRENQTLHICERRYCHDKYFLNQLSRSRLTQLRIHLFKHTTGERAYNSFIHIINITEVKPHIVDLVACQRHYSVIY